MLVKLVETANITSQYKFSWKVIKEIKGRKNIKQNTIKRCSNEDLLKKWHGQFQNPPGRESDSTSGNYDVPLFLKAWTYQLVLLRKKDLELRRKSQWIVKQQAPWDKPEVVKNYSLDDIILHHANSELIISGKTRHRAV